MGSSKEICTEFEQKLNEKFEGDLYSVWAEIK